MLGEKMGELAGKVTSRRVLPGEVSDPSLEISFQSSGKVLGIDVSELGTFWSRPMPGGTYYGEGQGLWVTRDSEGCSWKGTGVGKPNARGGVSYRGSVCLSTSSDRLSRLNGVCAVYEYELDENGNCKALFAEWK